MSPSPPSARRFAPWRHVLRRGRTRAALSCLTRRIAGSRRLRQTILADPETVDWLTHDDDVRAALASSEDFRARFHVDTRFDAGQPGIHVDVDVTDDELDAAFERVRATWEAVGGDEPFWSVISADEYRGDSMSGTEGFYASGAAAAEQLLQTLRRHGIEQQSIATCLEFGCGVGRVTVWLAREFGHVVGCDISRPHLELAERALDASDAAGGVELLRVADRTALDSLPPADLVVSTIVLQHNPPPIMAYVLRRLLETLRPGGHAVVQIPTYDPSYEFRIGEFLSRPETDGILMHVLPQRAVFDVVRRAGCTVLEVYADHLAGMRPKTVSNTFVVERPAGSRSVSSSA